MADAERKHREEALALTAAGDSDLQTLRDGSCIRHWLETGAWVGSSWPMLDRIAAALAQRDARIGETEEHLARKSEAMAALSDRLQTIVDEQVSPEPVLPADALVTIIERHIASQRARIAELERALSKVNDIRNSIIGMQTINWSEHVYPLVEALNGAGCTGMPYPEAREHFRTMLERAVSAEAELAVLKLPGTVAVELGE